MQLALAQSVAISELEKCAGLESAAAKLACYEALTSANEPPAKAEPRVLQAEEQAVESRPEPIDPAPASAPPEPPAQTRQAAREAEPVAPAPQMAENPGRASSAGTIEPRDPMEGLGEDQGEPAAIEGTVVKVSRDSYGRLVFHFENGQEWRQIEKRYFPHPRGGQFDVTISTGMMGEHRLQVEGAGRRVAIKRVR